MKTNWQSDVDVLIQHTPVVDVLIQHTPVVDVLIQHTPGTYSEQVQGLLYASLPLTQQ